MPVHSVDLQKLAQVSINRVIGQKLARATTRAAIDAITRVEQTIKVELIPQALPRKPVDRGAYSAGWRTNLSGLPTSVEVANKVPYAAIIEYGARPENIKPGRKMIDALTEWAKRKFAKTPRVKGGTKPPRGPKQLPSLSNRLIRSLTKWIKKFRIGALLGTMKTAKGEEKKVVKAMSDAQARSIAWAIAKHMQKAGIFGPHGLRIAEKAAKRLPQYFREALHHELR